MPKINLTLTDLHPAQLAVTSDATRFNVLDCGRRWGKNVLAENMAVETMLAGHPVGWFEPTYKTLADVWREVKNILQPVSRQKLEQEHRIELITGGVLEMWSLDNPDAARGRKYKRAIVNEAAMIPNLGDIWNMVIRPMLADLKGDGWFFSTPKGRNFFWQMFQWGQDPEMHDWKSWKYSTRANPFIAVSEIDAMRRSMPERVYLQEIEADFIEDAGGIFRRVMEAATATRQDTMIPGHQYIAGVDWARTNDATVFTVLDTTTRELVYLDRMTNTDYNLQRTRLRALYERFKPGTIIAEYNSMGGPMVEQLQREGLPVQPFTTTNATKATAIDALALAFEQSSIRIVNDPVLIGELQAYEGERLPSGLIRYSAPEGMHDDCVMALCLAWQGVGSSLDVF